LIELRRDRGRHHHTPVERRQNMSVVDQNQMPKRLASATTADKRAVAADSFRPTVIAARG
jgi:hypothetical protein